MDSQVKTLIEQRVAQCEVLSEGKWKDYVEDLSGVDRAFTAQVLENCAAWLATMNEVTRAVNVGNFDKFAFPLIRAVFPNLIAQEIVSVQPMNNPVGLIFYFDFIYGTTKGKIKAGTPVFSSLTGHPGDSAYSGDEVKEESAGTGDGAAKNFVPTLDFSPVIPGSFEITDGTQIITDDGNGALIGDIDVAGTNTIDYISGAVDVDFATAPASAIAITADYRFDNEGNDNIPQIDLQLTSAPVTARINKLRTRYSLESAQNLKSLHGLDAETELVAALAEDIKFEIDRTIIIDLVNFAQATAVSWPLTPPSGISFTEHKLSFVDVLIQGSNNIFAATRRGQPNFVVVGLEVSNVIESLPGFKPAAGLSSQNGIIYIGDLNGRWKIYKDPYNLTATGDQKNFLIGYKGGSFLEAGYVYAPYIPFYTTPTVILDDFIARKGMATQWGRRRVNGRFYANGTVTGSFSP